MKVVVVSKYPPLWEGISDYARHVSSNLASRSEINQVTVLANTVPGFAPHQPGPVDVRRVWRQDDPCLLPRLASEIVRLRPDSVWYNTSLTMFGVSAFALTGFLLPALTRRLGIQSVVTLHELPSGPLDDVGIRGGLRYRAGVSAALKLLQKGDVLCVTVDRFRERLTPDRLGQKRIVHLPLCGYDEPIIEPFDGVPTALVMTSMAPYKGVDVLVDALQVARGTVPEARLIVTGIEHPRFPGYAARLQEKLGDRPGVSWLGTVPDDEVRGLMRRAHVVVAPYLVATGSSATIHRAVALGRPIVATDLSEFRAMAQEEDLRIDFVPRSNPVQLGAALVRLWTDSDHRDSIVRHNFESAQRNSLTATTDAYLRLFRRNAGSQIPLEIKRSPSGVG